MNERRHLLITATTAILILGAVIGFNAVIDPFGMARADTHPGWNVLKPGIYQRVRLAKAYDVRHLEPRAVVLGTSRSHMGLRTTHPGWETSSTYNLAFDGATTREMHAYLVHAHAVQPLERVVLGLDTWHLSELPSGSRPGFDRSILLSDSGLLTRARVLASDLRILASFDTLQASWDTIHYQTPNEPQWLAPDGQRLGELYFRRPGQVFHERSPRVYFEQYDRMEIAWRAPPPRPKVSAAGVGPTPPPPDPSESSLAWIERIIDFCALNGIDLRIFITPMHAHQMEMAMMTSDWTRIEEAKRRLVRHLAKVAERHSAAKPFPLWDFTGYSSVATEPLPPKRFEREMRWYWDSSHFKEIVGDWVLDRLFQTAHAGEPVPQDFGVRLRSDNVETALATVRAGRASYRRERSEEISVLEDAIREILGPDAGAEAGALALRVEALR